MKILMVCLGNICRSPIADGLLRKKVKNNNLSIFVDSAGTSGFHEGETPDKRMISTANYKGTPIDFLSARRFVPADFDEFDLILAMDDSNRDDLLEMARNDSDKYKIHLLIGPITDQEEGKVPDPYYGTLDDFEEVYDIVDQATDILVQKIISNKL